MLAHRMTLVCFRLFGKNLGNLQEFFWANGSPPPLTKNCPYAYEKNTEVGITTEGSRNWECKIWEGEVQMPSPPQPEL